jgi:putative membrane protein
MIIDPVALRGDRWFLGQIYYYPEGGVYFGVTLANFLGWFFVCFVILRLFVGLERLCFGRGPKDRRPAGARDYRYQALGPAGLYFGVLGFNLFMTFWIGEVVLGIVGVFIALLIAALVAITLCRGGRAQRA